MANLYQVSFRVFVPIAPGYPKGVAYDPTYWKNPSTGPGARVYGSQVLVDIHRSTRSALVLAASPNEVDIRPVIQSHLALQASEQFSILDVRPLHVGTEGQAVWQ